MSYDPHDEEHPRDPVTGRRDGQTRVSHIDGVLEVYRIGKGWVDADSEAEDYEEESMRAIEWIVIHASGDRFGSAVVIDGWHKERGWDGVGYHFVVSRGEVDKDTENDCVAADGSIEMGRPLSKVGAHAKYANENTVGICMIGNCLFTEKQLESCRVLCWELMERFGLGAEKVIGHREAAKINQKAGAFVAGQGKTCPILDMDKFRDSLKVQKRRWWVRLWDSIDAFFLTRFRAP